MRAEHIKSFLRAAALTPSSPVGANQPSAMMLVRAGTRQALARLPYRAHPVQRFVSAWPFTVGPGRVARGAPTSFDRSTREHGCPSVSSKRPDRWRGRLGGPNSPTRPTRGQHRRRRTLRAHRTHPIHSSCRRANAEFTSGRSTRSASRAPAGRPSRPAYNLDDFLKRRARLVQRFVSLPVAMLD